MDQCDLHINCVIWILNGGRRDKCVSKSDGQTPLIQLLQRMQEYSSWSAIIIFNFKVSIAVTK